jgi:hypothetical protein
MAGFFNIGFAGRLGVKDAISSGQALVLKKQFLIDHAGDVGRQANPAILFHAEGL